MSPYRRPVRFVVSNRRRITFVVFMVGAVLVAYWLIVLTGRVNRQEAVRTAAAEASYTACVASIPVLRKMNKFVVNAENVANVLLVNSIANHANTPAGTPMWRTQIVNIRRLDRSIRAGSGLRLPVPTRAECEARRERALHG